MSQTELDQSFLTSTPPTVLEEDVAIESPEIESPTVESPSVESPGLFEYEGPFGIQEYDSDWFNNRRRGYRERRTEERERIQNVYDQYGEIGEVSDLVDTEEFFKDFEGIDLDFGDLDFDVNVSLPKIDLKKLGLELPEWRPDLRLDDLKIGSLNLADFDLSVPDGIEAFAKAMAEEARKALKNLPDVNFDIDIDFPEFDLPSFSFEGGEGAGEFLENLGGLGKDSYKALSEVQKFRKNPTVENAKKVVDKVNSLTNTMSEAGLDIGDVPEAATDLILDAGAVASIADFVDDPNITNAVEAYQGADFLLESYTDLEGMPGSNSKIAKLAGKATVVLNAATAIDEFAKDPSIGNALIASSSTASAVSAVATTEATKNTAATFAATLGPIAAVYTAFNVLKTIQQSDIDYTRSDGYITYKNGEFSTEFAKGSDGGEAGWAEGQTRAAIKTLNELTDTYKFQVDEKKLSEVFNSTESKSFITSNPEYAQVRGEGKMSLSASDTIVSLLKSGALKPSEDTPEEILENEAAFSEFLGDQINKTQDEFASIMWSNYKGRYKTGLSLNGPIYETVNFSSSESAKTWLDSTNLENDKIRFETTKDGGYSFTEYVSEEEEDRRDYYGGQESRGQTSRYKPRRDWRDRLGSTGSHVIASEPKSTTEQKSKKQAVTSVPATSSFLQGNPTSFNFSPEQLKNLANLRI